MAGENAEDVRTGQSDEFLSKTKWERFQVLIMGPVMNMLLAFVLTVAVLYGGIDVPAYEDQPPVVGIVMMNSAAERADIRPGDRILSVADRSVKTWEEFFIAIGSRPNREVSIEVLRDGKIFNRRVTPE